MQNQYQNHKARRQSPNDLMKKYVEFVNREPEHANLTVKGFVLLMLGRNQKPKVQHKKGGQS